MFSFSKQTCEIRRIQEVYEVTQDLKRFVQFASSSKALLDGGVADSADIPSKRQAEAIIKRAYQCGIFEIPQVVKEIAELSTARTEKAVQQHSETSCSGDIVDWEANQKPTKAKGFFR